MHRHYRILSIDGGGIMGVFPAAFMAYIEEATGKEVGKSFDLIAGTSTGAILALGLGLGYRASEMRDFYLEMGPRIFSERGFKAALLQLFGSKYRADELKESLTKVFGDRLLGESRTRLIIPALDADTGGTRLFKTAHHPAQVHDYRRRVVEIAMATTAAPSFFPPYRSSWGVPYLDGGLWANSPLGLAVVEAVGVLGWDRRRVRALSLGCTASPLDIRGHEDAGRGALFWVFRNKLARTMYQGQASAALGLAGVMVGAENILRVNPVMPPKRFAMDDAREVESLRGLGTSTARDNMARIKAMFLDDGEAEPFVPAHTL